MSQELLYTSAPNGLKPGSRGFCTVLSSQGMPAPLATAVEGLSGYRPIFPPSDERASQNPIVLAHLKLQAAGKSWNVLSRVAEYGLDYSGRPNKLAHHVVIDKASEKGPAGPAALLGMPEFMRTDWQGEPKVVPLKAVTKQPEERDGVCVNWLEATGEAGWAGVIAESFLANPDRLVILFYEPGQSILPLFEEAISLLPPEKRWDVTFSTYFTGLLPATTCNWRGIITGTKEATESKRFVDALRIDLNQLPPFPEASGELVEAARTGVRPKWRELSVQDRKVAPFVALPDREINFASISDAPPELGDRRHTAVPTKAPPKRSEELKVSEKASGRLTSQKSILWVSIVVVVLGSSFVLWRKMMRRPRTTEVTSNVSKIIEPKTVEDRNFESKEPELSRAEGDEMSEAVVSDVEAATLPVSEDLTNDQGSLVTPDSNTKGEEDQKNETPIEASEKASTSSVAQSGPDSKEPEYIRFSGQDSVVLYKFKFDGSGKLPSFERFSKLSKSWTETSVVSSFKNDFKKLPPTVSLYAPTWFDWRVNHRVSSPEKEQALINVEDVRRGAELATGVAIVVLNIAKDGSNSYEYLVRPGGTQLYRLLAWCRFDIDDNSERKSIVFSKPFRIAPDHRRLGKDPIWKTEFPSIDFGSPEFSIENLRIQIGGQNYEAEKVELTKSHTGAPPEYVVSFSAALSNDSQSKVGKFEPRVFQLSIVPKQGDECLEFKVKAGSAFKAHEQLFLKAAQKKRDARIASTKLTFTKIIAQIKSDGDGESSGLKEIEDRLPRLFQTLDDDVQELRTSVERVLAGFRPKLEEESTAKWMSLRMFNEDLANQLVSIQSEFAAAKQLQSNFENAEITSIQISVNCRQLALPSKSVKSQTKEIEAQAPELKKVIILELTTEGAKNE